MTTSNAAPYIYADNAATTPLSPRALEAMMPYLTCSFGNPSGIHRVAREAATALQEARSRMAELLGAAAPGEVYFTSGGSESDNWVLRGAVQRFRDAHGNDAVPHIVTSAIEHHAVLHCCRALEAEGVRVTYLPVDEFGRVAPEALERALSDLERTPSDPKDALSDPEGAPSDSGCPSVDLERADAGGDEFRRSARPAALVSIMMANNEVGTIQSIRELAAIAHAHGAPFHTDAVQAVGHIPVDVQELGVDALSLSGHKFHGPRGVGALYLREGFSIPPLIAGGAQERGERAGTENLAGIVGMVAALEEALEEDAVRVEDLRDELVRRLLGAVDGIALTGAPLCIHAPAPSADSTGNAATAGAPGRLPSIASFTCDDVDGELLVVLLDRAGVAAATGSACSTGSTDPSHVLTAMGIPAQTARGALRLSLANDVTEAEIDLLCERVPACIKRARLISKMN